MTERFPPQNVEGVKTSKLRGGAHCTPPLSGDSPIAPLVTSNSRAVSAASMSSDGTLRCFSRISAKANLILNRSGRQTVLRVTDGPSRQIAGIQQGRGDLVLRAKCMNRDAPVVTGG
jgi:hypothetical protein